MTPTEPGLSKRLATNVAVESIAAAVTSFVVFLVTSFKDYRDAFKRDTSYDVPRWVWLSIAFLFLFMAILLRLGEIRPVFKRFARRSRLRRPEALRLDPGEPKHLIGRDDDIKRLTEVCDESSLVFLVGPPGVGKTAFLKAGLKPAWAASGPLFPVYVKLGGEDWIEGPREALCRGLWNALSEKDREDLKREGQAGPEHVFAVLGDLRARIHRTPVILLDQFDDYQARHHRSFRLPHGKKTVSAEDLIKGNPFWRELKALLEGGAIHCVITTSVEGGPESIRFLSARTPELQGLEKPVVKELLTRLTEKPDNPVLDVSRANWERLTEYLAEDLEWDGLVLPARMGSAFRGLAGLQPLTWRAYCDKGRLRGIEASQVDQGIRQAAWASHLSETQVRNLLLALVDRESGTTPHKTEAALTKDIRALEHESDRAAIKPGRVAAAMDALRRSEIALRRRNPKGGGYVWTISHDYWKDGILEAEHCANGPLGVCEIKFRSYERAGTSYWRRWWALLSPWEQVRVASQYLRGRRDHGRYRSYVLWSVFRWAPYMLLPALLCLGWLRMNAWRDHREARALLSAMAGTATQSDAVWRLAASRQAVRTSFLEQALTDPGGLEHVKPSVNIVTHALVGLDPAMREKVFRQLISLIDKYVDSQDILLVTANLVASSSTTDRRVVASALLARAMNGGRYPNTIDELAGRLAAVPDRPEPGDVRTAFEVLVAAVGRAGNEDTLVPVAARLKAVAGQLAPGDASEAFVALIAAMEGTTNAYALRALAEGLNAVKNDRKPGDLRRAFATLVRAIEKRPPPGQLVALVEALAAMRDKPEPGDAQKAFRALVDSIEEKNDHKALRDMARSLATVRGEPKLDDLRRAFKAIVGRMEETTAPEVLGALAEGLAPVQRGADSEHAHRALRRLVAAMETNDPTALLARARGLMAVPGKQASDVQRMFAALVAGMDQTTDDDGIHKLADGLKAVMGGLEPGDSPRAFAALVGGMKKTNDRKALGAVAEALKAVPGQPKPDDVRDAFDWLIVAVDQATDSGVRDALVECLKAVKGVHGPGAAPGEFKVLVIAMRRLRLANAEALHALAEALKSATGKREPSDVREVVGLLVAAMKRAADSQDFRLVAESLAAVPGASEFGEVGEAFQVLVAAMQQAKDPGRLRSLAESLRAMPGRAAPDDAHKAYALLFGAMVNSTEPRGLLDLAEGLKAVPGTPDPVDVPKAYAALVRAIDKTNDPDDLGDLASGLKAVPGEPDPRDVRKSFAKLADGMAQADNDHARRALAKGLTAIVPELEPSDVPAAFTALVGGIEKTMDSKTLDAFAGCLKAVSKRISIFGEAVPEGIDLQALVNLAKLPNCNDGLLAAVLEAIERQSRPVRFKGDVWKMVKWAQRRNPPLDVSSRPRRP